MFVSTPQLLDLSRPIIFTSRGNMQEADLRQQVTWEVNDDQIIMADEWYFGTELVKRSVHIYQKKPLDADMQINFAQGA